MDKKLRETTNLGLEIMNSKLQVIKEKTWSRLFGAALKHGIRNPESGNGNGITETETEYVKEGSKRSI